MSDTSTSTDIGTDLNTDNASNDVATAVLDKDENTEKTFIPGELKWTSDRAKKESDSTINEASTIEPVEAPQVASSTQATPDVNRKRWAWAASLTGIFLASFLIGYTAIGGQYWREVFDIHTWIHMVKLLFG